jgi:hypothetical protein
MMIERMKNNKMHFLVIAIALVLNLPAYGMDRGWLGSTMAALSSTSVGSYVSSMRTEDIKLAGALLVVCVSELVVWPSIKRCDIVE